VTGTSGGTHRETGAEVRAQFVHILGFSESKFTSFQQYADTKQVTEAVARGATL
jgi:ketosteroid isomerase-like protein